jgi:hypothetical protein
MNNSDYQDFNEWQNGDEEDNVPHNNYPPFNPKFNSWFFYNNEFKKMWEEMQKGKGMDELANYLNISDIIKEKNFSDNKKQQSRRPMKKPTTVNFTQEEYFKLIEIRGYLAITEQFAHVKALDKVLNHIKFSPNTKD